MSDGIQPESVALSCSSGPSRSSSLCLSCPSLLTGMGVSAMCGGKRVRRAEGEGATGRRGESRGEWNERTKSQPPSKAAATQ